IFYQMNVLVLFFFSSRRRHTRSKRDWSSDVCSSDLEPDLVEIHIDQDWKDRIRESIPLLPDALKEKYVSEYELPAYDAHVLTLRKETSDFFNEMVESNQADAKLASNWLMGGVSEYLNKNQVELGDTALTPENLSDMIKLIED